MNDLEESALRRALGPYAALPVEILPVTESTNLYLKTAARQGTLGPRLAVADRQTGGRGRLGRSFQSPGGMGLYMSLLLPMPAGGPPVTVTAAVAVCLAMEETTGLAPKIKWVNDLFLRGKKVCGILAEGAENQVVVGIGVNVRTPEGGFPGVPVAGALDTDIRRDALAGRIAAHLLRLLETGDGPSILAAYRARMPLIGATVTYTRGDETKTARILGVDADGGLTVDCGGQTETLRAGEISLGSDQFASLL